MSAGHSKEKLYHDRLEQLHQVTRPISPPNVSTKVYPAPTSHTRVRTLSNSSNTSGKDGPAITSNIDDFLKKQSQSKKVEPTETFEPYSRRELRAKDGYQSTEELEMYERERVEREKEEEKSKEMSRVEQERASSSASNRKSVSFDLTDQELPVQVSVYEDDDFDDDRAVFVDDFMKREKIRETEVKIDSVTPKVLLEKPIKSILRSASPSSSSQFSTLERQYQSEAVASWIKNSQEQLFDNVQSEIEQENPFKKTFVSQEELREMEEIAKNKKVRPQTQYEPLQTKIPLKKPVSASTGNLAKPPVPPKPKIAVKQAEIVKNEALRHLHQDQGDFVEFEHDPVTNTIREVRPKSEFNPDGPLPPLPAVPPPSQLPPKSRIPTQLKLQRPPSSVERPKCSPPPPPTPKTPVVVETEVIEILPAKYETLPKMETAKVVHESHENSKENVLVPDDIRRTLLLQENDLRNALIDSNANVDSDADTNNNVGHFQYLETASQASSTGPSTSGVFSPDSSSHRSVSRIPVLNPQNVFPTTQILPVHYTQLPAPQQPGYYQTVPINAPIQLCQAPATQVTATAPVVSLTYPQSTYYTTPAQYHLPLASPPIFYFNHNNQSNTFTMTNEQQLLHPQQLQLHQHWNNSIPFYTQNTNPSNINNDNISANNTAQNPSSSNNNTLVLESNSNFVQTNSNQSHSTFQVETGYVSPIEMYRNTTEVEQIEILSTGTSSGVMSPITVPELTPINVRASYHNASANIVETEKVPQ